jgi:heme exporter protein B
MTTSATPSEATSREAQAPGEPVLGQETRAPRVLFATLMKDLRLEWRSKDAINSMLFFALLVVVVFSFSFDPTGDDARRIAGGLIWVAFLFAAVVALGQTWAREIRNQVLDAYRVSTAPANDLFLAKALGNFLFVSILEVVMTPLFVVFYNLRVLGPAYLLPVVAILGTWALVVNGTFFAAISLRTRSREVMLPLLLFPISIPALLGMVEATKIVLTGESSAKFWIVLLAVYDLVFTTVCLALFESVLNAE